MRITANAVKAQIAYINKLNGFERMYCYPKEGTMYLSQGAGYNAVHLITSSEGACEVVIRGQLNILFAFLKGMIYVMENQMHKVCAERP